MYRDMLLERLHDARKRGYGVLSFNFNDCWDIQAVVAAAEELNAPIMVESVGYVVDSISLELCAAIGKHAMDTAKVPVFLHLDHCKSVERCKAAVDLGYPSVMIDASALSLEENIAATREVADYAHARGMLVEAEIGKIKGHEGDVVGGEDFLVQVPDAVALAEQGQPDMLAVGFGTQHGFYKGAPQLNFQRLREVRDALGDMPLVMHGGTGIPEEDVRTAIDNGICKINVGTQIRYTQMKALAEAIKEMGPETAPAILMEAARPAVKEVAMRWIKTVRADGKA
nr:class II fructose-bisphosphate aldolase [Maliibacterium massiliense]